MLYYQVQCLELKMGIIYTVVVTGFNQVGSYNIGNFDNICAYGSDALDQSFIKNCKNVHCSQYGCGFGQLENLCFGLQAYKDVPVFNITKAVAYGDPTSNPTQHLIGSQTPRPTPEPNRSWKHVVRI